MTADDEQDKSPAMSDADVANGEGPGDESAPEKPEAGTAESKGLDPDAPGTSALGLQDGDPVEPSEPG